MHVHNITLNTLINYGIFIGEILMIYEILTWSCSAPGESDSTWTMEIITAKTLKNTKIGRQNKYRNSFIFILNTLMSVAFR